MKKNKKSKIKPAEFSEQKIPTVCPYCKSGEIVKYGFRKKKLETIQVYFCKKCQKKFTPLITKSKTYSVAVILRSLIYYNQFYNLKEVKQKINKEFGLNISVNTLRNWLRQYKEYIPFLRMREFIQKNLTQKRIRKRDLFIENRMFHGQIYDFKYYRKKTKLLREEDFKHFKLKPIQEFLEMVENECPHRTFQESDFRASEFKGTFDLEEVKIVHKNNRACDIAKIVLQAVANNKHRHERLQEFMFFCDSTSIAVEVPVILDGTDVLHFNNMLNFKVPLKIEEDQVITGHIDIVQLRNGIIHILDFKPSASKEKPVDQLTIYALALSRLTGLRLYNFKCALAL